MNKKFRFFVGNLPFYAVNSQVIRLFKDNGWEIVDVLLIEDEGRPRGFGYVTLNLGSRSYFDVLKQMDGYLWLGRELVVEPAEEISLKATSSELDFLGLDK